MSKPKRIVLFFDGTRNTRKDVTNVFRLYSKVRPTDDNGMQQVAVYENGVGTKLSDFFTGAVFGRGVFRNVRNGYQQLRNLYSPGDEVFLFGFSRGAFTARSLAGFVAQYGILKPESGLPASKLYGDYRQIDQSRPIYRLPALKRENIPLTPMQEQLLKDSTVVRIRFIGVWDTVGTIGLPWGRIKNISTSENRFHELDPRLVFDECCQALAVDEQRPHYSPLLWTTFVPNENLVDGLPPRSRGKFEQRWFVGAHSNVGGGYKEPSPVYKVPLRWMEEKAVAAGLAITEMELLDGTEHLGPLNDSFAEFFPYKIAFWTKRSVRLVLRPFVAKTTHDGKTSGRAFALNEIVDPTVMDRIRRTASESTAYLPQNIKP